MATRSLIFYKKEDGALKGSFFNFDGYVEHTGVMLLRHYNSYDNAKALVDFSPANTSIKGSLEEMAKEGKAYKDAGEHYSYADLDSLIKELKNGKHYMIEFVYLFDSPSNSWVFTAPERIDSQHYEVFFMDLRKYCIGEGIKIKDGDLVIE